MMKNDLKPLIKYALIVIFLSASVTANGQNLQAKINSINSEYQREYQREVGILNRMIQDYNDWKSTHPKPERDGELLTPRTDWERQDYHYRMEIQNQKDRINNLKSKYQPQIDAEKKADALGRQVQKKQQEAAAAKRKAYLERLAQEQAERERAELEALERQKQQHIQQVENTAYNREMQKSESSYNQSKRMDSWRAGKEMLQGMQAFAKSNNDYVALPDNSTDPSLGSSNSSNRRKSGLENLKTQSGLEKKGQEPQPPKKRTPKECWEAYWRGEKLSPEEMDLVNEYNTRK